MTKSQKTEYLRGGEFVFNPADINDILPPDGGQDVAEESRVHFTP